MTGLMLDTHGSQHVTLDALRSLPIPQPLGTRHQPIPHAVLVDALVDGITDRGWAVKSSQLVVAAKGAALFGTMDLRRSPAAEPRSIVYRLPEDHTEIGTLFGFRSSVNQSTAIRGVAGKRVFVCSNMCFSGDMFVMRRKSTTRINLPEVIADGLDQFLVQTRKLDQDIERLQQTPLGDTDAKARIFDLFNAEVLPSRLLAPLARHYFQPADDHTDCQPRSLWGLNNAATRSIQVLKPSAQFAAAQHIGQHFHLAA